MLDVIGIGRGETPPPIIFTLTIPNDPDYTLPDTAVLRLCVIGDTETVVEIDTTIGADLTVTCQPDAEDSEALTESLYLGTLVGFWGGDTHGTRMLRALFVVETMPAAPAVS